MSGPHLGAGYGQPHQKALVLPANSLIHLLLRTLLLTQCFHVPYPGSTTVECTRSIKDVSNRKPFVPDPTNLERRHGVKWP